MKTFSICVVFLAALVGSASCYGQSDRELAKTRLADLANQLGHEPLVEDIMPLAMKFVGEGKESLDVWKEFQLRHEGKSPISKSELILIQRALRDSIESLSFDSEFKQANAKTGEVTRHWTLEYSSSGDDRYLKKTIIENGKPLGEHMITTFDGTQRRQLNKHSGAFAGSIDSFQGWSEFHVAEGDLLFNSMQIDGEYVLGRKAPLDDIVAYLEDEFACVLSDYSEDRGQQCVVVVRLNSSVWLDVERGFCVSKIEGYKDESKDGKPVRSTSFYRIMEGPNEFRNGLWLPTKLTRYDSDKEGNDSLTEVTFTNVKVNEPIDKSKFTDIFPNGTYVSNSLNDTIFQVGESNSIARMLDDATPQPASSSIKFWLVGLNLIIFAVVLFLWLRGKRNVS